MFIIIIVISILRVLWASGPARADPPRIRRDDYHGIKEFDNILKSPEQMIGSILLIFFGIDLVEFCRLDLVEFLVLDRVDLWPGTRGASAHSRSA